VTGIHGLWTVYGLCVESGGCWRYYSRVGDDNGGQTMKVFGARIVGMVVLSVLGAVGCRGGEEQMNADSKRVVRYARGSGRWFPGEGERLRRDVERYMADAEVPAIEGRVVAGFAPHAGYQYSGKVAGYTFRPLQDAAAAGQGPETVVILGFSHRAGFRGVALLDGDAVSTPVGETPLDTEAGALLAKQSERIRFDYAPHAGEHSAENEIPFAQVACPGVPLVVGITGDHDLQTIADTVEALVALGKEKRIVVIASTDMLHDADYDLVTRTDKATLEKVKVMDHEGLVKEWSGRKQTFCGICPVLTVMRYAQTLGCKQASVLHYRNSGDDHPESRGNWVVGYGAVVFAVGE
jgi:MEMO1 family protein